MRFISFTASYVLDLGFPHCLPPGNRILLWIRPCFRSLNEAADRRDSVSKKRPDIPKDVIESFCRRHHITKLSVFGSYLREDFGPESDIDFLVEFDRGHIPTLFDVAGMEIELSEMLGRKVDLRTAEDLSRYFRNEVVAQAKVQYAEG